MHWAIEMSINFNLYCQFTCQSAFSHACLSVYYYQPRRQGIAWGLLWDLLHAAGSISAVEPSWLPIGGIIPVLYSVLKLFSSDRLHRLMLFECCLFPMDAVVLYFWFLYFFFFNRDTQQVLDCIASSSLERFLEKKNCNCLVIKRPGLGLGMEPTKIISTDVHMELFMFQQ